MSDTYKFNTKGCSATQCGASNPVVATVAMAILQEANQFTVALNANVQPQTNIGITLNKSGIQIS